MNNDMPYRVNQTAYATFVEAVVAAKPLGVEVFEVRADGSRIRRWHAPVAAAPKRRHVLVNADGSRTEFSKVRR